MRVEQANRNQRIGQPPRLDERHVVVLRLVHEMDLGHQRKVPHRRDGIDEGPAGRRQAVDRALRIGQGAGGEQVMDRAPDLALEGGTQLGVGRWPLGGEDGGAEGLVQHRRSAVTGTWSSMKRT